MWAEMWENNEVETEIIHIYTTFDLLTIIFGYAAYALADVLLILGHSNIDRFDSASR